MMQPCASAAKLRSGGPILPLGMTAMGQLGTPPPRTIIGDPSSVPTGPKRSGAFSVLLSLCRTQNDALWNHTLPHEPPESDKKLARQGHDHGFARASGVLGPGSKPLRQGAVFLEHEKSPGQLDHASAHPSVAGSGQPFLPTFFSALVGRASEPGITRDGPSVAQVSRQRLLHQHVRGLDADPDHACQQAHHGVWSVTGRSLQTLQTHLLNLPDLFTGQTTALHVAPQLSQRIRRYWVTFGRAQTFEAV